MDVEDLINRLSGPAKAAYPLLSKHGKAAFDGYADLYDKVRTLEQVSGHSINELIDLFARGFNFNLKPGDY